MKKIALFLSVAMLLTMLAVPAAAANFTPSVEQKEAPAVTTVTDKKGEQVVGVIRDAQNEEVVGVPTGNLVVTPVSKADQAEAAISEPLTKAHEQIKNASSLKELAPSIEQVLQSKNSEARVSDLVVRDVFDVSVFGTYEEQLAVEGNTITVRFDLKLSPSALLLVLHNHSGSDWEIIPDNRVVRNADGSVDVTFDSLSPVAFVVDSYEVELNPGGPTSPQTGDSSLPTAGIAVVLLGCAVLTGAYLVQKKRVED